MIKLFKIVSKYDCLSTPTGARSDDEKAVETTSD